MTNVPIEEQLGFSIEDALSAIRTVDDALQQVVQSFAVGLSSALETLTGFGADVTPLADSLDVAGLGPAIDAAVSGADATVPIEGDTAGLTSDIEAAADTEAVIPVEGDTSDLTSAIETATDVLPVVPVDADVSDAETSIAGLSAAVDVPVDADIADAQAELDALGLGAAVTVPVAVDVDDAVADLERVGHGAEIVVPVDGDTSPLAADIEGAVDVSATVPIEGDTSGLTSAIEAAIEVPEVVVLVDADVTEAAQAVESLSAAVDVPVVADLTGAQADLDQLGLGAAVDIPVSVDTAQAVADIDAVGDGTQVTIPVDGDTSGLEAAIDSVAGLGALVAVDGDTAELTSSIDEATDVTATVPIDADVSAAQAEIGGLEGETVVIPVEVDTAGAEADIQAVGEAAGGASGKVLDLGAATGGFNAVAAIGRGEATGLGAGVGLLGPQALAVAGGFTAAAGTIGLFFNNALDAQAAVLRLDQSMGPLAERIENLRVGDLNADLSDLALSLGSDDDALRNIAATLFNFQTGAGTADLEASKFSETVLALSARAVAANPALGSMEQVAGRLGNVLGRGGRFASQFGINLSSVDIKARAAENAANGLGDGVSFASLQLAGGQLALEKYGDVLTEEIAEGTKNPIIQLAALRQKFSEAAEEIGQPLVAPIFDLLRDIEPIAESVARVLGGLAQVALPSITLLASGLSLLEAPLGLIADGLEAIAAGVGLLPDPLQAVVGGLAIAALGYYGFATAVGTATVAVLGFVAANPALFAVIGTVALLGAAFNAFGDDSEQAAKAKEAFDEALFDNAAGATFQQQIAQFDANLAKVVTKFIEAQREGSLFRQALDGVGGGVTGLSAALQGSDADFQAYVTGIQRATLATGDFFDAAGATVKLEEQRSAFRAAQEGQIAYLVSTNQLTAAEAGHLRGVNRLTDGTVDLNAVLEAGDKIIQKHTASQTDAARESALAGDAYTRVAREIKAGTISAADAAQVAIELGIAEADATTFINDQTQALVDQADARILATTEAEQLRRELAAGNVTIAEAQTGFLQLGVSIPGVASAIDGVTQSVADANAAIDDFVSGAVDQLPSVSSAITSFSGDVDASWEAVVKSVADGSDTIQADLKELADNQDPQRFADNLNEQAANIARFAGSLATLVSQGFGELAGILAQEGPEAASGLAAALASEPAKAKIAQASLVLRDTAVTSFATLLREKFPELYATGVEVGGTIVGGIGSGIDTGVPGVADAASRAAAAATVRFDPLFSSRVSVAMQAAAIAIAEDPTIGEAAGQKGLAAVRAFEQAFGPLSTAQSARIALEGARNAIAADPSLALAGAQKGVETAEAFRANANVGQAATDAFDRAAAIIPGLVSVPNFAGLLGVDTGRAFAQGIVNGIANKDGEIEAAGEAAAAAADRGARRRLGIRSPSQAGMEIGEQYVAGIAQGLAALGPVEQATAALTLALVPDLRPALKQTPSLAPGIAAQAPTVGALAGAFPNPPAPDASANTRLVKAEITVNKTDPDPKHFADELAWMLQ